MMVELRAHLKDFSLDLLMDLSKVELKVCLLGNQLGRLMEFLMERLMDLLLDKWMEILLDKWMEILLDKLMEIWKGMLKGTLLLGLIK